MLRHAAASPRGALLARILAIACLASATWLLLDMVRSNMARRGMRSGFDFLWRSTGFDLSQTLIPYGPQSIFLEAFLVGLLNTLLVAGLAILLASLIGAALAACRLSGNPLAALFAQSYVELFRNIPPLLQLFFWYFAVLRGLPGPRQSLGIDGFLLNNRGLHIAWPEGGPAFSWGSIAVAAALVVFLMGRYATRHRLLLRLLGVTSAITGVAAAHTLVGPLVTWDVPFVEGFNVSGGAALQPELVAILLTLSLYQASYVAETLGAGIRAVGPGQVEAAAALGLTRWRRLRLIVLPQALRMSLPALATIWVSTLKGSSIAAAIAYPDLTSVFGGTVLNLTGQAVEVMFMVLGTYLLLGLAVAGAARRWERHLARSGR